MRTFFRWLYRVVALFSFLLVLTLVGGLLTAGYLVGTLHRSEPLPSNIVLRLDLDGGLDEAPTGNRLSEVFPVVGGMSLLEIVETLDRASLDPRVRGLLVDLSGADLGLAEAEELRAVVDRFRASGRFAHAFADSVEGARPTATYYLASGFERFYLQPSGLLDIRGPIIELPFFAEALDEAGVVREVFQRHEYKGVAAPLTETRLTPSLRRNYQQLVDSFYARVTGGIATARRLGTGTVDALFRQAPLLASEAIGNGLADALLYRDQAVDRAMAAAGIDAEAVPLARYRDGVDREADPDDDDRGVSFAVLTAEGGIVRGEHSPDGAWHSVSSGWFAAAIRRARQDDGISAVILRIDSPGGSYTAADTMLRELQLTREAGKPVIVSMSDVAASGGYYLALAADHVIAQPTTLTGSIGVVGGKVSVGDALERIGIGHDRVSAGGNAGTFSLLEPFDLRARDRMRAILDRIYDDFTDRVATARRLDPAEVDAVARGRVFSGEEAARLGLVDVLGGYAEARSLARAAVDVAPGVPVRLVPYPPAEDPVELILEALASGDLLRTARAASDAAEILMYAVRRVGTLIETGGARVSARAPLAEVR